MFSAFSSNREEGELGFSACLILVACTSLSTGSPHSGRDRPCKQPVGFTRAPKHRPKLFSCLPLRLYDLNPPGSHLKFNDSSDTPILQKSDTTAPGWPTELHTHDWTHLWTLMSHRRRKNTLHGEQRGINPSMKTKCSSEEEESVRAGVIVGLRPMSNHTPVIVAHKAHVRPPRSLSLSGL